MSAVTIPIPPGKVLHWKLTENGFEVEFMRFLTPGVAKNRADRPHKRKERVNG